MYSIGKVYLFTLRAQQLTLGWALAWKCPYFFHWLSHHDICFNENLSQSTWKWRDEVYIRSLKRTTKSILILKQVETMAVVNCSINSIVFWLWTWFHSRESMLLIVNNWLVRWHWSRQIQRILSRSNRIAQIAETLQVFHNIIIHIFSRARSS